MQLINILHFLDSSKLSRRLLVNSKMVCSRKFFLLENDFKTSLQNCWCLQTQQRYVKWRPKSLSNYFDQMNWKNYQNLFGCAIKKHQEHPQICLYIPSRFEHTIFQGANKISYDSFSNLKGYWNERISCQRTIIHIFL